MRKFKVVLYDSDSKSFEEIIEAQWCEIDDSYVLFYNIPKDAGIYGVPARFIVKAYINKWVTVEEIQDELND